jgi:membrane-associated phospholipid phosphatase
MYISKMTRISKAYPFCADKRASFIRACVCAAALFFAAAALNADDTASVADSRERLPFTLVFHDIGWNALRAVSSNYGLPFAASALGTTALIASGIDWNYNRFMFQHPLFGVAAGWPALTVGYFVPVALPLALYGAGYRAGNGRAQIAAFALAQTALVTFGIQSGLKALSGRADPGIVNLFNHQKNTGADFSGRFNWFNGEIIKGWPSGHAAQAFAAASALSQLYPELVLLKAAAYSYALFIAFGVSTNVHWLSESISGAVIGWAVGRAVGMSFARLYREREERKKITPLVTPGFAGIRLLC